MKTLTAILILAAPAFAQTFEVASIKPSDADPGSSGITTDKGRMTARNVTVKRCIRGAFGIPEAQILGGPKWLDENRFDIQAKAAGPAGDAEMMLMLQALLAERFKLSAHRATRALSGYVLTVAKTGIKAKPSTPGAGSRTNAGRGRLEADGCTMPQFALKLASALKVPVSDLTETEGSFDFKLEWAPDEMQAKPADVPSGPSIFSALQEQLGLKLQSRKVPAEVLVIDRVELPSEN